MTAPGRALTRCARSIRRTRHRCTGRWEEAVEPLPARRYPHPRQGQHRNSRRPAHHRRFLALESPRATQDATVVRQLRAAGAVIFGKANLTEFANFIAIDMPAGYSSLGGSEKPLRPGARRQGRADRAAGRVELGLGGRGRRRAVRGGNRHRNIGLTAQSGDAERARHGQADRGPHQPCRHRPHRTQPGYRRPDDPHRARCGDPAQCARSPRPADPQRSTCSVQRTTPRSSTRMA